MRFELEEILTIVDKVKQMDLDLFEYTDQDVKLKIKGKQSAVAMDSPMISVQETKAAAVEEAVSGRNVESPMVGAFYAAPSPDAEPFVKVGDHVKKGQTVGIVEAMKLMNEIEAECDGVIAEIFVKNEQMVEYGQPLMRIVEG